MDSITARCAEARKHIAMAFAEINLLPHGTAENAAGLIEAQTALAAARISLDKWQENHDPMMQRP